MTFSLFSSWLSMSRKTSRDAAMSWLVPVTTSRKQAWRKWAPYWCCVDRECGSETDRKLANKKKGWGDWLCELGLAWRKTINFNVWYTDYVSHLSCWAPAPITNYCFVFISAFSDGLDMNRPTVRGSSMCLRRGSILAGIPGPTAGAVTPLLHSAPLKW